MITNNLVTFAKISYMKNKYLTAWVILLLLLGSSCKKQEELTVETTDKKIEKTDLIGIWHPVKTETTGLTKDGMVTIADSSENVKSYVPSLVFSKDEMVMGGIKGKYNISIADEHNILTFESGDKIQKFEVLKVKELFKLKPNDSSSISISFYFKRRL